mmetsp:Transcript_9501/g.17875  ORF Transcript_9501/g.17875 Transcript_9501/m.17875 type:complete len:169 (+) Transcript_9501:232-738(+)|eukprot:CAMPEP_0176490644 /NCGR_PEP_ID=MMETSP0200_2-20121128/7983_1 /TAXON_ID=947934 /ORGANISM="Chaetoceros sp., Strain GSL56" /LENGTH=168 /DNA_ID=CAMNT_0017887969 /DNA_START=217 /DNA_END=723 /DNA_ORIENTATION=+
MKVALCLISSLATSCAFAPSLVNPARSRSNMILQAIDKADIEDGPRMNPDKPELPEIKGDFDWDAKFGGDDDWIVENIPGKMVVNEIDIAAQNAALTAIEEKYRKIRLEKEYEDARILGWTSQAETFNGRFAMFFLAVGLLTEYWTGVTIPGQIEEMLRVGGFIGPDY